MPPLLLQGKGKVLPLCTNSLTVTMVICAGCTLPEGYQSLGERDAESFGSFPWMGVIRRFDTLGRVLGE